MRTFEPMAAATSQTPPRRPVYLALALSLCWFLAFTIIQNGYFTIKVANAPLAAQSIGLPSVVSEAWVEAVASNLGTAIPISVAQLLLGGLLLFVSSIIVLGGRVPLALSLQALAANAVLAVVHYAMSGDERSALIRAFVELSEVPGEDPASIKAMATSAYYWAFRLGLLTHLLLFAVGAFALTRQRARHYLAYAPDPGRER